MRKWQMSNVMAQSRHAKNPTPIRQCVTHWDNVTNLRMEICLGSDNIENPSGKLHYAQRMLESFVGSARIDQVRESELMNMSEALKRTRVEHFPLIRIQTDKNMDGVSDFVLVLRHDSGPVVDFPMSRRRV